MVRSLARGRMPKPLALLVTAGLALFWVAVAPVNMASAAVVGGFEIDGDQTTESFIDWRTVPAAELDVVRDEVGNLDHDTIFDSGDQEDQGPAAWDVGTTPPSGKSDIGNVLVYDRRDAGGDTWAYFAWDRDKGTGTGRYYIELNQLDNSKTLIPNRSIGDVRITIGINGSDILACQRVETWDGDVWSGAQNCASVVEIAVNTVPISDYFDSPNADSNGVLDTNKFVEAAINLSDFGLTTCPVTGFSTINLRSQEGNENGENGKLKDLATGPIDIESDCSAIEITKTVSGDGSGQGAVFVIKPDPTPGSTKDFLVVTAGEGGSVLIAPALPGAYTVTELAPPAGYLLPAGSSQTVTAEARGTAEVTFNDVLGEVTFTKGYDGDDPALGASFQLTRTHEWSYDTDPTDGTDAPTLVTLSDGGTVDVTDNGSGDGDSAVGSVAVDGLQGGTWCITETAAPAGWVPADPDAEVCFDLGPTDAAADAAVSLNPDGKPTFDNQLRTVNLQVEKTGSVPGIDDTFPLAGASFSMFLDDGDGVWEPVEDVQNEGSLVTDETGIATWTGLDWQQKYWLLETAAPSGYAIGLDPNPTPVEFAAPTADGVVVTVEVDNPREEFDVQLTKVDEVDQSLLEGGGFQLWRETNGVEGLQLDGDLNVNGTLALVDGRLTFSAADHHIPWGYTYYLHEATPPTGYDVMTPNPIVIDGMSSDLAGKTVYVNAEDPRLHTGLKILKTDDFDAPVEGAVFQLYLSDGDEAFEPCTEPGCTGDVVVGGEMTSGEDGLVEWTGLTWGLKYWVHEVSAPSGYELMDPRQVLVEIPESAAGGVHDLTDSLELVDPRLRGGFTITKVTEGLPDGEEPAFSVQVDCGRYYNDEVSLLAPSYKAAVTGVPVGQQCTVTEPTVPDGWAHVSIDHPAVTVVEDAEQQVNVTVTNERLYDSFDFVKVIEGTEVDGEQADFTVRVDCASADPGADDYDQNVVLSTPSLTGSTDDIPAGLGCTFSEIGWDTGRYAPVDVVPSSATVGDDAVGEIVVTNERLQGTLTVTKTVENPVPGETDTFPITVDCSNGYRETFDLAHGESASIGTQPVGVTCTVTEGEIDTTRYVEVSDAEQQGTVRAGQTETVTVENERLHSGFDVVKDPQGLLPGEDVSFEVVVDCSLPEWEDSFELTLTLANDNMFTGKVTDVPTGATCTVTEPSVPEGWTFEDISPATVTVVDDAQQQVNVTVTNERQQGQLTVLKVDGSGAPLAGATFALWQSTDDVIGSEGDEVVDTCTTGGDGTCTIDGLDWGFSYFWQETAAPTGYNLATERVQGPVELTAGNVDTALQVFTFVNLRTQIVTTPFVDGQAVSVTNMGDNVARVDENDVVRDRAIISDLSEPASGTVTFELFGPYYDTTLNGMSFEEPDCTTDPVFVSTGNPMSKIGTGTYEAYSEELAVADAELEPGLYQWVAEFVPAAGDDTNVGKRGACPDPSEMFVVRGGDRPALDKRSDPASESLVQPGEEITYTIHVTNSGDMPIPADEAIVVDILDPWLGFGETTKAPDGTVETVTVDEATGVTTVTWKIGELAAGHAVTIQYTAVVDGEVPQNEALDNVAKFLALEDSTVHVVPNGDLTVVKSVDPEAGTGVIPGETLTYTMAVTATGELDQTDVLVADYVPGYDPNNPESLRTSYVMGSADCDDLGECQVVQPGGDGEIVWSLGDMEAGSTRTVTFQVTVDEVVATDEEAVDVGDVINAAAASSSETDWTPSNEVVNPVAGVLGIKIPNEPTTEPAEPVTEPAEVLGTKLPRTGAPIGAAAWLAGSLLVLGIGLRAAGSRRRAQHRA